MATQTMNIQSDIRLADDAFESAFRQGDAAALAQLYTEDGMLFPSGSDFVKGKQAIQNFWKGAMDMGIEEVKLDIVEVELQGDMAIEVGQYKLMGAEGSMIDHGKYLVTWKQEGDQWKIHRDIWNTNQPAH